MDEVLVRAKCARCDTWLEFCHPCIQIATCSCRAALVQFDGATCHFSRCSEVRIGKRSQKEEGGG